MFTVKECTQDCRRCGECEGECKFVGELPVHRRIFAFDDGGVKAVGVLALEGGDVVIYGVFGSVTEAERDIIIRALLNVCRNMNPIWVRVKQRDGYYTRFGFTEFGDGMRVRSTEIKFK